MILNFVLLIWEERNLGCYEHARAGQERARARRARKKSTSPPTIYFFGGFGFSQSWWIWEILDKYPALVWYYSEGAAGAAAFLCHYYLLRT